MRALIALEDGTWFEGRSFTGAGETSGEVIFNTGMTGYQEVLTDPSYVGQMVCMTYPHIGNYGVNLEDVESDRVQVEAFIVKECCPTPSNWRAKESLPGYLKRHRVMGIEGIDTRALTRHLRIHGAQRGIISTEESDPARLSARARELPSMEGLNLADKVTPKGPYVWTGTEPKPVTLTNGHYDWPGTGPRVVAFDFGIKWNILRLLAAQGLDLLVVPASFTAEQVDALAPDALFYSNGPGDPAALPDVVGNLRILSERYPVAGICLGHQLLGLAMGGRTFKLKFGHHGLNHPVKDLTTGRIEISSQNHGFCVDVSSLDFLETTHVNLNDGTLEGFQHKHKPILAIQHHPEAGPGPHDSRYFFSRFRDMIRSSTGK
ncbi:glutamine-hydrolyzing carbamoyl-phosphate synthase small subunit [Desulfocurvibacter africanus]|uniref:Carbamoyl phosphate synthase small chain n=1 Tax=Desulfocurvibacter africanus subsp. africanus str. Walvis Bay TaxID=690850 RepID=F3YVA8_DESAF|nr:glutamine-hydrolyzing carbamoyl-phosphate synthase small subunit [Desulfocurvibacter africanus]EGJ48500.1 carbamoyl-phosphate synthase, small subunit [Desulfocurvibacter africanus subsp. africanus str. Walvis Bay]